MDVMGERSPHLPPAPPVPVGATVRFRYDGAFIGPLRPPLAPPPPVPVGPDGRPLPVVSEAVLALPLGTKELVRQALDLLTRSDAGLRSASFFIGLEMLVLVAPAIILVGLAMVVPGTSFSDGPDVNREGSEAWSAWLVLAAIPAAIGYLVAGIDARGLASAVIGGRVEGRPLRLRESIAVVRRRFWQLLGAQLLVGLIAAIASWIVSFTLLLTIGLSSTVSTVASLVVSLIVSTPFVYVPASIMLGEVGPLEAIGRSFRLVGFRKRLAIVITLFSVLSQFIVLFGLSEGADVIGRLVIGSGLSDSFPAPLVVPIAAALTFAVGTLMFLVEAIAAAPAVHAFEALTHYTGGLEVGRREPAAARHLWQPWFTPGLLVGAIVALAALLFGVLSLPS